MASKRRYSWISAEQDQGCMMNSPIRLAMLGCGFAAQQIHIPRLLRLVDHFQIAAVADVNPLAAQQAAEMAGCPQFADLGDMLNRTQVDAVVVLTPLHAQAIEVALSRGLDVFAEKPLCVKPDEAYRLAELASSNKQVLMVGAMRVFDPAIERAKEIISQIGPLRWVEVRDYCGTGSVTGGGDLIAHAFQAGLPVETGPSKNLLQALLLEFIHDISILRGVWGGPIAVTSASAANDGWSMNGQLRLPGNVPCNFAFCEFGVTAAPVFDVSLRLFGEQGCAEFRFGDPNQDGRCRTLLIRNQEQVEEIVSDPFTSEWLAFERAIRNRTNPVNYGQAGAEDVHLAWRMFTHLKEDAVV
jgi:predicted dehydrogenase